MTGAEAGEVAYRASWFFDDGQDLYAATGPGGETATVEAAKALLAGHCPPIRAGGLWWCQIDKGRYVTGSEGLVAWEPDEAFVVVGIPHDGRIDWGAP